MSRDLNLPHNEIRLRTVEKKYRHFPQSSEKEMKVLSLEGDAVTAGMETPSRLAWSCLVCILTLVWSPVC